MDNNNYREFLIGDKKIILNDKQHEIVTSDINQNMLIIACAGSGKTTTILFRIKYLIDNNVLPESIILTTFTRDAAKDMKKRLKKIISSKIIDKINIGTFDSIAYTYYNKYFKKNNKVDISEFSYLLLEYLNTNDGVNIYNQIKYIFFDEFQDCNDIQFKILKFFSSKNIYITAIGDDAQNIYQFRGSNIKYILNYEKDFDNVKVFKLVENYRSTPEIINIANISISHNKDSIKKEMIPVNKSINVKPFINQYKNNYYQAINIINHIRNLISKGVKLNTIAILARNTKSLKIIEEQIEIINKYIKKSNKEKQKNINNLNNNNLELELNYVSLICDNNSDIKPKIQRKHLTITTIHKSKGLEWNIVFLIGCNDNIFPSKTNEIDIQDDRRLFYVGITRAKQYLYISYVKYNDINININNIKFKPKLLLTRFIAYKCKNNKIENEIPLENFNINDDIKIQIENDVKNKLYKEHNFNIYKKNVTNLISLIKSENINKLRKNNIIPTLNDTIKNIYDKHEYNYNINKYYLHMDFGTFIDEYITRLIGLKNINSYNFKHTCTEQIINIIELEKNEFAIYNKYINNFNKKIIKILITLSKQILELPQKINLILEMLDKNDNDKKYIIKIDDVDKIILTKIINKIINSVGKKIDDIQKYIIMDKYTLVLPIGYIPDFFITKLINSYLNYQNNELDNKMIMKDIYNISLTHQILEKRRRLIYKDVDYYFTKDEKLFSDIEIYVNSLKNHNLECKKVVYNEEYDIIGEIDLLDITDKKIIDFKCSCNTFNFRWILQLLTYAALLRLSEPDIIIEYIEVYNPLLGLISTMDIREWYKNEKLSKELLQELHNVREENLSKEY